MRYTLEIDLDDIELEKHEAEGLPLLRRLLPMIAERDKTQGVIRDDGVVVGAYRLTEDDTPPVIRHLKRGGFYDVIGKVTVQAEAPVEDCDLLVTYRDRETGKVFARPPSEMTDGRFEDVEISR